jgi:hypothetical protein
MNKEDDTESCNYYQVCSNKENLIRCPYCERHFCLSHIIPYKVQITSPEKKDRVRFYYHPCIGYEDYYNDNKETSIKKFFEWYGSDLECPICHFVFTPKTRIIKCPNCKIEGEL